MSVPEIRSLEHFLQEALHVAFQYSSFAIWYDQENHIQNVLLTNQARAWSMEEPLEKMNSGYLVHPFNTSSNQAYFFPCDALIQYNPLTFLVETGESLLKPVQETLGWKNFLREESNTEINQDYYGLVHNAVEEIERGSMKKVVLARKKFDAYSDQSESLALLYKNLRQAYPNAFVSMFKHPQTGLWISASPEILVKLKHGEIFETVALAGTQPAVEGYETRKVSWTQKEIEEQALVSRYIINCFKAIRLREFEENGPRTIQAGRLLHLRTDFTVRLNDLDYPDLASTMLRLLHPTSAVCGMPLAESRHFLETQEGVTRSYFSGFTGPVNMQGHTQLFVHLRCAELTRHGAWLYAGAGITQDSIADNEWKETELKMDVIGRFL
ncbi:MAG: chorismate-binding protein [Cytophagaceae bacterium]|jgi:isochorismate synthase|nr:chorismate-binding protein [Cytophagaceae bacterium]